jgi:integrase
MEAHRLLAELPEHLAAMARFAMLTGLRQRNVRELSWSQVDLDRRLVWVRADQANHVKFGVYDSATEKEVAVAQ